MLFIIQKKSLYLWAIFNQICLNFDIFIHILNILLCLHLKILKS